MKAVLMALGVVLILMGLLWAGQGAGLILWPASSFMLQETQWILIGLVVAGVGLMLVGFGARRKR
jgi:hypothetical protein